MSRVSEPSFVMLPFFALTGIQLQAIKNEMQYMLQTETILLSAEESEDVQLILIRL